MPSRPPHSASCASASSFSFGYILSVRIVPVFSVVGLCGLYLFHVLGPCGADLGGPFEDRLAPEVAAPPLLAFGPFLHELLTFEPNFNLCFLERPLPWDAFGLFLELLTLEEPVAFVVLAILAHHA